MASAHSTTFRPVPLVGSIGFAPPDIKTHGSGLLGPGPLFYLPQLPKRLVDMLYCQIMHGGCLPTWRRPTAIPWPLLWRNGTRRITRTRPAYSVARNSAAFKGLAKPAVLYRQIAEKYKRMTELIPFSGANGVGASVDRTMIPEVLGLARECEDLEEQAMSLIGEALD